ncbi:MAG: DNA replication and repair protein RecF [Ruminococcaceae bacterium]|nr:DNA replication and repair protein RecF [Oscillospiraceae bacterium]
MIIKKLKVKNFRNIKTADFLFSDKTNIISGNNAQGKTNLMEALACAVEKSFRTNKAAELLPENEKSRCEIEAGFFTDNYPDKENIINCSVSYNKITRKINGLPYKDALKLYPQLKTIVFIPEDLYTVKGNPDKRRELCDETADMMNKVHHDRTMVYLRALKQKNTFLSGLKDNSISEAQRLQLTVWNEELAKAGVNVMCGRLKYFNTLSKYTCEYYKELNKYGETLEMEYISSIAEKREVNLNDNDLILNIYLEKLQSHLEKEIILGHTLVGVHRDDIEFRINGRKAKDYGSQGQIRSIAVAIRLAQAKMFGEKWGEEPIVILDDVLSELDEYRREFILKHIVKSQVFITGCNENDFGGIGEGGRWKAINGEFEKI